MNCSVKKDPITNDIIDVIDPVTNQRDPLYASILSRINAEPDVYIDNDPFLRKLYDQQVLTARTKEQVALGIWAKTHQYWINNAKTNPFTPSTPRLVDKLNQSPTETPVRQPAAPVGPTTPVSEIKPVVPATWTEVMNSVISYSEYNFESISSILNSIQQNTKNPHYKKLATTFSKISELNNVKIYKDNTIESFGKFSRDKNTIRINFLRLERVSKLKGWDKQLMLEQTVLHEIIHALTAREIDKPQKTDVVNNIEELYYKMYSKEMKRKDSDFRKYSILAAKEKNDPDSISDEEKDWLMDKKFEYYGLVNVHEFVTMSMTNPQFRDKLKQTSYWRELIKIIADWLKISKNDLEFLENNFDKLLKETYQKAFLDTESTSDITEVSDVSEANIDSKDTFRYYGSYYEIGIQNGEPINVLNLKRQANETNLSYLSRQQKILDAYKANPDVDPQNGKKFRNFPPSEIVPSKPIEPEKGKVYANSFTFKDGINIETPFKLNEQQAEALQMMADWINDDTKSFFTLKGYAGTGKTSTIRVLSEYIKFTSGSRTVFSSPTHRANAVLKLNLAGEEVMTLHKAFGLSPLMNLEEFSARDLQMDRKNEVKLQYGDILVIDESSMINDSLFDFIANSADKMGVKVLFMGDPGQIKPPKQMTLSKAFSIQDGYQLTKVERTGDNPLLAEATRVRSSKVNTSNFSYDSLSNEQEEGITFTDSQKDFFAKINEVFTSEEAKTNPLLARVVSGTNENVSNMNQLVRKSIFGKDAKNEYNVGDIIMGYNNFRTDYRTGESLIINSGDYFVTKVSELKTEYWKGINREVSYYMLALQNALLPDARPITLPVLSKNTPDEVFELIGETFEDIRKRAIAAGKSREAAELWKQLNVFKDAFMLPKPATFGKNMKGEPYVKIQKTIDYGYAHTVHKSQGGTYKYIFVDSRDFSKFLDLELRNQLEYVSITRAQKHAYVLFDEALTGKKQKPAAQEYVPSNITKDFQSKQELDDEFEEYRRERSTENLPSKEELDEYRKMLGEESSEDFMFDYEFTLEDAIYDVLGFSSDFMTKEQQEEASKVYSTYRESFKELEDENILEKTREKLNQIEDVFESDADLVSTNTPPKIGSQEDVEAFEYFVNNPTNAYLLPRETLIKIADNKINELFVSGDITFTNEENQPCAAFGGKTSFTKGSEWSMVKDLKGYPSHADGGVDINLGKGGFSFIKDGATVKAAHGLVLPAIKAADGLVVSNEDPVPKRKLTEEERKNWESSLKQWVDVNYQGDFQKASDDLKKNPWNSPYAEGAVDVLDWTQKIGSGKITPPKDEYGLMGTVSSILDLAFIPVGAGVPGSAISSLRKAPQVALKKLSSASVSDEIIKKQGFDLNFLTRPLTPFTKNELTKIPGQNMAYRKIGNKKGLQDLIDKQGAQAPAPLKMKSGLSADTPFFGMGKKPDENYSGIFAVEADPFNPKYNWTNWVAGTNNYGVAPLDAKTGKLLKNLPLEDLNVYRKKWFSNSYKKLDKNNLEEGLKYADTQHYLEKLWKWGVRGGLAYHLTKDEESKEEDKNKKK